MDNELEQQNERRLSVIMFSDIVGYSKMMQAYEDLAMKLLDRHNKIVREALKKHNGTEVKVIGDAFLVSFTTVADAVRCAIDIQESFSKYNEDKPKEEKILLRIGIHMGDIIVKENDVFGDGVNIASRIEPLAEPGGICISQEVYNMVRHKIDFEAVSLGPRELKNIKEKIGIYEILVGSIAARTKQRARRKRSFYARPVAWVGAGLMVAVAVVLISLILKRNPEPSGMPLTRILKTPSFETNSPNISPDGNWVVYVAKDERFSANLYVVPAAGGEPRKITNDTADHIKDTPCFTLDASRIIFHRVFFDSDTIRSDLYSVPALGGTSHRVIRDAEFVVLSVDGSRLAFLRRTHDGYELNIANADGSGEKNITSIKAAAFYNLAWSPDSKRIAFLRTLSTPNKERYSEIFIRDLNDGSERQLTFDKKLIDDFCWASTGEIIFNSTRGGNVNLWAIPEEGGTPKQVTLGAGADRFPRISKDAKRLVYVTESETSNLWTIDLERKQLQQLTFEDAIITHPVYSPSGSKLIYHYSDFSEQRHLIVCNKDGSDPSELMPVVENYTLGARWGSEEWFHDDKTILFNAFRRDTIRKDPDSIVVSYAFFQYDLIASAVRKIGDGELYHVSRDGKYILYAPPGRKRLSLVTLALTTSPDKPLKEITSSWDFPTFSFDSKNVITGDSTGNWFVPVEGGKPSRLIKRPNRYFSFVHETFDGHSLLGTVYDMARKNTTLVTLHPSSGKVETFMELSQRLVLFPPYSSFSPDGKSLVFTRTEIKNRIVLLDNFR